MNFAKYHGLGNDFVIMDDLGLKDYSDLARKCCDRKIGIGADGFIVVKQNPLEMVFYNEDGSRAPMCGNGIRCFARYVYEKNLVSSKTFDVQTLAGVMTIEILDTKDFYVKVNMGSPIYTNESIKASDNENYFGREIEVENKKLTIYSLFMGTIHTVVPVDNLEEIVKTNVGEKICNSPLFKEKTNVNFVQVVDKDNVLVKTYERGVGWTCACGTGACATYVVLKNLNLINQKLNVILQYGKLVIEGEDVIFMSGPATKVFEGEM